MSNPPHNAICWFCASSADDRCPRCRRPRCAQHGHSARSNTWPDSGYRIVDLCPDCSVAEERYGRKAGRVVVAAGAAVVGMAASAFGIMLLGGVLGLGAQLTVLSMLVAELSMGTLSAYAADRQVQRWLIRRDQRRLGEGLPKARLLER